MSVIQLIDEHKRFSTHVDEFFERSGIARNGLDYHVVAVFGSQSTGKSTLLNALYGTEFGVMDASKRQQTTKGIWMGRDDTTLVLDVEGTDGRERGEDQDFERKAALFALATSELLIVNMWEHQVGLYVGANMALLKTVFEVNLSLFVAGHGSQQRSRIVFVIRDHMGLTPLTRLAETLNEDLEKHWATITKPPGLEDSKIGDFFDLEYAALPHKVLQPEQFQLGVRTLRGMLEQAFRPEYHRGVPIDGWSVYAAKVWEQIEMNKDLDLPTHQILVARFRTEEIATSVFAAFQAAIDNLGSPFGSATIIPEFGAILGKVRNEALAEYDQTAGRYHETVYNEKRLELLGKIDGVLTAYFSAQLVALKAAAIETFKIRLATAPRTIGFKERIAAAREAAIAEFSAGASEAIIDTSFYSASVQKDELEAELEDEAATARAEEMRRVLKRISKQLSARFDAIPLHFTQTPRLEDPWAAVLATLEQAIADVKQTQEPAFGLGGSPEEIARADLAIEVEAWKLLRTRIIALSTPDALLQRLRDLFEDSFKYTPEGLPIVWSPGDDIDAAAVKAREATLELLPIYASARLKSGAVLVPPAEVIKALEADDPDEEYDLAVLLAPSQLEEVDRRFRRVADLAFVEAKRSVMQLTTHIPVWVYAVIVVLGWNEFTMVLRNPLLLMLALMIAGGVYVVYSLGLAPMVLNVAESSFERVATDTKQLLREYLLSDDERERLHNRNASVAASSAPPAYSPASSSGNPESLLSPEPNGKTSLEAAAYATSPAASSPGSTAASQPDKLEQVAARLPTPEGDQATPSKQPSFAEQQADELDFN